MTRQEYKEVLHLIEHGYLKKAIQVFLEAIEDQKQVDHLLPEISLLLNQLSDGEELSGEDRAIRKARVSKSLLDKLNYTKKSLNFSSRWALRKWAPLVGLVLFTTLFNMFINPSFTTNEKEINKLKEISEAFENQNRIDAELRNKQDSIKASIGEKAIKSFINRSAKISLLENADTLLCKQLECSAKDSEEFLSSFQRYLAGFWLDYQFITRNKFPATTLTNFCNKRVAKETVLQLIDTTGQIRTFHRENFCDTVNLDRMYQGLRFERIETKITDVFVTSDEKVVMSGKKKKLFTIRFVLASDIETSKKKCDQGNANDCDQLFLKYTIVVKIAQKSTIERKVTIEGVMVDDAYWQPIG